MTESPLCVLNDRVKEAKRDSFILFSLLLVLLVLGGCVVGPDYVRPDVETPVAFKEDKEWKVAEPKDGIKRGAWWEIYQDPQLDELERQVNIANQNIALYEAQYRQAVALVQQSKSGLFPIVGASASASRSGKVSNSSSQNRVRDTSTEYLLTGDISWELDLWGKVRRSIEASEASAQASAADLESIRLSMQASLAQNYFQLRFLDAEKKLLDATVVEYEKYLELTKNRYAGGIASRADVAKAETQLKTTRAQAIDIAVQRSQYEHAIAVLIGKPPSSFSIPFIPLSAVPPRIPVSVPSELLERRPDIAAAERRMASANARIGVAKAAYYPSLSLDISGGFDSSKLNKWLVAPSRFWSIGTTISDTILDFGLRKAQTEEAIAAYEASVASYRQTVLTAFQEVEDNLSALRILEQESQAQTEAVNAARQSVTITLNQYKAGITTYLDVVAVVAAQLSNEKSAIEIDSRRMVASVLLIKALGGGWDAALLKSAPDAAAKDATSEPKE